MKEKFNKPNILQLTEEELYQRAAEEVMLNMPFENDTFNPETKEECVIRLKEIVAKKYLTIDWIKTAATANVQNSHTAITYNKNDLWSIMSGMDKDEDTREEFLLKLSSVSKRISEGKVKFNKKSPWDKYFGKKGL